jgi:TolB-like protein
MSVAEPQLSYEFGEFRLDAARQVLLNNRHEIVPLTPRAYDLLLHFLEHPGELLGREALMKVIWPDTVVEENNLSQHLSALRRTLGDLKSGGSYIVTVPRRGYRFVAPVRPAAAAPRANPAGPSVAVLPFFNLGGDPTQEYFGDGLAEEVIHLLSRVPGLAVASRTSSFSYKGKKVQIQTIASELRVAMVLEGSVRWSGDRFRITAQLIDAQTGYQIWSRSFDRRFEDLFQLQGEIANSIVEAIRSHMQVTLPEAPIPPPPTRDLEAYRLYLQGASLAALGAEPGIRRGIMKLQQAVDRDPNFARALGALAVRRVGLIYLGAQPDVVREIEQEAERALALDGSVTEAHTALGILNVIRRRWFDANKHFSRAQTLGASDPIEIVHALYLTASVGKVRQAHERLREAHERSAAAPVLLSLLAVSSLALPLTTATTDAAARYADLAVGLGMQRNAGPLPIVRLYVALRRGQQHDVISAAHEVVKQLLPTCAESGLRAIEGIAAVHADPGLAAAALEALHKLVSALDSPQIGPVLGIQIVAWYTMMGAVNHAYEFAHRAIDTAQSLNTMGLLLTWLWHPELEPFRRDKRFEAFVARLAMMEFWQDFGPPDGCEIRDGRLHLPT